MNIAITSNSAASVLAETRSAKSSPNGSRYPLVDGTRQRHFDGANLKPRKLPENAPTPTTIVLVLFRGSGARCVRRTHQMQVSWIEKEQHNQLDQILRSNETLENAKKHD